MNYNENGKLIWQLVLAPSTEFLSRQLPRTVFLVATSNEVVDNFIIYLLWILGLMSPRWGYSFKAVFSFQEKN